MRFIVIILRSAGRLSKRGCRGMVMAWLGLLLLAATARAQEGRELEYEVKAAFLIKFGMFVQWPTNALAADVQAPLVVGILGDDPFGGKFDQAVKTEKINGRTIQLRRARRPAELLDCQIVFICASEAPRFAECIAVFRAHAILTVADEAGFAGSDAMIGFFKETGKVRFAINPTAIEAAGLKASSKLLQVGRRMPERVMTPG